MFSLEPSKALRGHPGAFFLSSILYLVLHGFKFRFGSIAEPFEVCVAERLRQHGYEVIPQVGVSGYFIDLAVVNPQQPGTYLLGVECDGATYHSSKAARDRDRLRQEVLERLGWKLYRIWSTDWFTNSTAETEKLIAYLRRLCLK